MCLFLSDQVNRLIWTTYLSVCLNDRRGFDGGRGSGGRGVALHLELGGGGFIHHATIRHCDFTNSVISKRNGFLIELSKLQ